MRLSVKPPMEEFDARLSLDEKPLPENGLSDTVPQMVSDDLSARVLRRFREEMQRQNLSQRQLSGLLGGADRGWSQGRIAKYFSGRTSLTVDGLEGLCFALGLQPVEVARDPGLEFCADLTPTELRLVEHFRQLPPKEQDAMLTLLHIRRKTNTPERHAGPLKKHKP